MFGRCFYLPKSWIPGYFDYFRKIKDSDNKDEKCSICFVELGVSVKDSGDNEQ